MAEAVKTESGKWLARAHVNGKCRRFTRRLKKEAEGAADDWAKAEEARAKAEKEAKSDKYAQTFKAAIDNYISRSDKIFSPATVRDYRAWQRATEPIAGYTIKVLLENDNQIIAEFLNTFSVDRSSKTVHCIYRFIVLIMRSVDRRIQLDAILPQAKSPAYHIPEDDTIRKFLDAAKGTEIEKAVLLAAFGSLRRSEVSALVPEDFDEQTHTVSISKAKVKDESNQWHVKGTKTPAGNRTISLPPEVFDRTKGGVALTPDEITAEFELLCKKVGFRCRFHDLRHYHASMLHALGVPDKYIMARGGWGSAAVLQGIYQHTFTDKMREVGDIVNQQYKKTVSAAVSDKKTSSKKTAQQSKKSERRSGVHG